MIDAEFTIPKSKADKDPLKKPNITMVVGQTGSGKSVAAMNMIAALSDKNDFEDVLFVTSNGRDPLLKTLHPSVRITSDPEEVERFMIRIKQKENPKKSKSLLILDDVQGSPTFSGLMTARSTMISFILSHRHYWTWVVLTAQTYKNSFVPLIRKNATRFLVFYPRDEGERESMAEIPGNKRKMKMALEQLRGEDPHQFLNIYKNGPQVQYIIGFNDREIKEFN